MHTRVINLLRDRRMTDRRMTEVVTRKLADSNANHDSSLN
jgi:hypothetical protein